MSKNFKYEPFDHRPPMPPHEAPKPFSHHRPHNHEARFFPFLFHPKIPQHFNFWCNKIIPLAYDDSLSYYEVLARTTDYLNNMLNDEKMLAMNVEELAQCFVELQHFVNDYFAFYQSKGLIVYDFAITNDNYKKYLPDLDTTQINTIYRLKFTEDTTQNVPENMPEGALPLSGDECILMSLSNFCLRRVGNKWEEVPPAVEEYSTLNNYQLLITDKDIFYRENNGDTWGDWSSIFGNFWATKISEIQSMIDASLDDIWAALRAEIERATNRENTIENNLNSEIARSVAKDNELEQGIEDEADTRQETDDNLQGQITAEVRRAETAESNLSSAITAENSRAVTRENELSAAITTETGRAQSAENALSGRIATWETNLANEILTRTTADETLQDNIDTVADDLSDEVTRAQAAEQSIRDNYIPNAGNSLLSVDTSIVRRTAGYQRNEFNIKSNDLSLHAYNNGLTLRSVSQSDSTIGNWTLFNMTPDGFVFNINYGSSQSSIISCSSSLDANNRKVTQLDFRPSNGYSNTVRISPTSEAAQVVIEPSGATATSQVIISPVGNTYLWKKLGKVYYTHHSDVSDNANNEIATIGDITNNLSGYIPNEGNNLSNINFTLSRDNISLIAATHGIYGNRSGQIIITPSNTSNNKDYLSISNGENAILLQEFIQVTCSDTALQASGSIRFVTDNSTIVDNKFYYQKNNGATLPVASDEVATIGDIQAATTGDATQTWVNQQLAGYIPNNGNVINNDILLTRSIVRINSNNGGVYLTSSEDFNITAGDDINITTTSAYNLTSSNCVNINSADFDVYTSDNFNIHTDNAGLNDVYIKSQTATADRELVLHADDTIRFDSPNGSVDVNSSIVTNSNDSEYRNAGSFGIYALQNPNNTSEYWGYLSFIPDYLGGNVHGCDIDLVASHALNLAANDSDINLVASHALNLAANASDINIEADDTITLKASYGLQIRNDYADSYGLITYVMADTAGESIYHLHDEITDNCIVLWEITNNITLSRSIDLTMDYSGETSNIVSTGTNNTISLNANSTTFFGNVQNSDFKDLTISGATKTIINNTNSSQHLTFKNCRISCANLFNSTYTGHLIIDGCIIDNTNAITIQTLGNVTIKDSVIKGTINFIGSLEDRVLMSNVKYGSLTGSYSAAQMINCVQI